jgi:hypothetical protein
MKHISQATQIVNMKPTPIIIPANNAAGLAAAAMLSGFRNQILAGKKIVAEEVHEDSVIGPHIAISYAQRDNDGDVEGWVRSMRKVCVCPTPPNASHEMKHNVFFMVSTRVVHQRAYHVMDVRMLCMAALDFFTEGTIDDGRDD